MLDGERGDTEELIRFSEVGFGVFAVRLDATRRADLGLDVHGAGIDSIRG